MTEKTLKITVVTPDEQEYYDDEEGFTFSHPSKYYFIDALGNSNYIHTRDRQKCIDYIKENYGGKYTLRTAKESKGSGAYTCVGTATRARPASRAPK